MEAFQHLRRVLERVNAVASTFLLSEIRFKDEVSVASSEPSLKATSGLPDDEDSNPLIQIWNFEPEKGMWSSAVQWIVGVLVSPDLPFIGPRNYQSTKTSSRSICSTTTASTQPPKRL
jgi:hypothetical protein